MKKVILTIGGFLLYNQLFGKSSTTTTTTSTTTPTSTTNIPNGNNLNAFLKTIQFAEGTYREKNPYAVTYGYDYVITDFSNHPALTGEWMGKRLPDHYCTNAGYSPGCKSTASGAYQIIRPTWKGIKGRMPNLAFDKVGQDTAATDLIRGRGALQNVLDGNFETAVNQCRNEWASLPASSYGQPTRKMSDLIDFYTSMGGQLN